MPVLYDRDAVLNIISLEFSGTPLSAYVQSPSIVRHIDWIDCTWPAHMRAVDTYPRVRGCYCRDCTAFVSTFGCSQIQYYCLMSTEGSYTDFHIDFGGTSVWYHVLRGKKRFFVIPPTPENLKAYEVMTLLGMCSSLALILVLVQDWMVSEEMPRPFLGDLVKECNEVCVDAGNTVLLPGGWIHSVSETNCLR